MSARRRLGREARLLERDVPWTIVCEVLSWLTVRDHVSVRETCLVLGALSKLPSSAPRAIYITRASEMRTGGFASPHTRKFCIEHYLPLPRLTRAALLQGGTLAGLHELVLPIGRSSDECGADGATGSHSLLAPFCALTCLRRLTLCFHTRRALDLTPLAHLEGLNYLNLSGLSGPVNIRIAELRELRALRCLEFHGVTFDDAAPAGDLDIPQPQPHPLAELTVRGDWSTLKTFNRMFPSLTSVQCDIMCLTLDPIINLTHFSELTSLSLTGNLGLHIDGEAKALADHVRAPHLVSLYLENTVYHTFPGCSTLAELATFTTLEQLTLVDVPLQLTTQLPHLPCLRALHIHSEDLTIPCPPVDALLLNFPQLLTLKCPRTSGRNITRLHMTRPSRNTHWVFVREGQICPC